MGSISYALPDKEWRLWTRGGTDGVYIQKGESSEEIEIPSKLLRHLVAEDIRSEMITKWEQMGTDQILEFAKGEEK